MFTIKAVDSKGHTVRSCESYRYNAVPPGAVLRTDEPSEDTLDLFDREGNRIESMAIPATVYVMNLHGRTVDTFHARPRNVEGSAYLGDSGLLAPRA